MATVFRCHEGCPEQQDSCAELGQNWDDANQSRPREARKKTNRLVFKPGKTEVGGRPIAFFLFSIFYLLPSCQRR